MLIYFTQGYRGNFVTNHVKINHYCVTTLNFKSYD